MTRASALQSISPPLARSGLGPPLVACAVVAASAVAGWNVARGSVLLWAPVLLTLLALYVSMRPEMLFVCWLFAAPFVQAAARETTIGSPLTNVLYVLPLGVFLLHMSRSNVLAQRLRWYDLLPLGYVAFIIGSQAVVDVSELRSPSFYTSLLHGGVLVGVAMYYLVAFGPLRRLSARHVAIALLSSCSIVGAMGIVEHFTHWSLWGQGPIDEPPRIVATLSNPAVLGAFLGAGIVVATAVLVWEGPPVIRRFSLVTLALTLPALFFTYTRAPMIAAVAVASVLIAMRRRIRVIGALVGLAAVLLVWSNWAEISSSSLYEQRAANISNVQGRLLLSKASLDLAAQRPLFGWGYGKYDEAKANVDASSTNVPDEFLYYYTSHNTFLTILVELGGAGLVVFLLPWIIIVCLTLRRLGSTVDSKWFTLSLLGILMVYVLTALTIDMRFFSFVPALAWIAVGLLRRGLWDEPSLE